MLSGFRHVEDVPGNSQANWPGTGLLKRALNTTKLRFAAPTPQLATLKDVQLTN